MTERDLRRRMVGLSVVSLSALTLAGSWLVVVEHDRTSRPAATVEAPRPAPATVQTAAVSAPVAGLRPAAPPRRRIVVVRRSRAS